MTNKALNILQDIYGYKDFRLHQAEIIDKLVCGEDVFALMPTGGGKSICYQIPAIIRDGVGIIISPLIALMQDQVQALQEIGVKAATINSMSTAKAILNITALMRSNSIDIVYVSPERLLTDNFMSLLQECKVALFAIDEAHCVSQWGHDFRAEYMQLNVLAEVFDNIPRIALTATADIPTRKDIVEKLSLSKANHYKSSFDRPNIQYRVTYKNEPKKQLLSFLNEVQEQSGIIYCLSRKKVEQTSQFLRERGYQSYAYHAGLKKEERQRVHDNFIKEEICIVVATIAFGMGIDKPNVRFVAHMDLPKSIESYYQETGRAGRDGMAAVVWMTYGLSDAVQLRKFIEQSQAPDKQKYIELQKLNALIGYAESPTCRRQVLLDYFNEQSSACGNCDTCLNPPETIDGTILAQKLLSTIYRTGQSFGGMHVIDVLLGKQTEKVEGFGHDKLTTFGLGKDYSKQQWNSFLRQLVAHGILYVDITGHGAIKLRPEARPILKGEKQILFTYRENKCITKEKTPKSSMFKQTVNNYNFSVEDEKLLTHLKQFRTQIAKNKNIPPYMVLHDKTLYELIQYKPKNTKELQAINGFGTVKIKKYGNQFIDEIDKVNL